MRSAPRVLVRRDPASAPVMISAYTESVGIFRWRRRRSSSSGFDLGLIAEARGDLLRPRSLTLMAKSGLVRVDSGWMFVGPARYGTQLVVSFEDDPRGGHLVRGRVPASNTTSGLHTCLGGYAPTRDFFSTSFSLPASAYAAGFWTDAPYAWFTVREGAP